MLNPTRHRYSPLLTALIVGLSLAWAALTLLTMASAPPVAHAQGDVRYVAPGGADAGNDCTDPAAPCATLQHAVDVANPGDEIRVAGGTYTDIHTRPAPAGYLGPAAITQVVYLTKSLALRGGYATTFAGPPDPELYPTTLDPKGQGRGLFIAGEITVTVEGLRVTGGDAAGLRGAGFHGYDAGGGVYVATATTVLGHNWVLGNVADFGGGLYLYQGTATLSNDTVFSNTAGYVGGGLALDSGHATINGGAVSSNTAGYGGGGLGLEDNSVITLNNNLISQNRSGYEGGGGLYLFASQATLVSNTITANTTSFIGGGLAVYMDSTAILTGNTIISNRADIIGGGIGVRYGHVALSGNRLVANSADYGGGLIMLDDSTAILTNNAIVGNQANVAGSGLGVHESTVDGRHTTIANNVGGDGSGVYVSRNAAATLTNTILSSQTVGVTTTAISTATLNGVLWYGNAANIAGAGDITVANQYTGDPRFAADGYHVTAGSAAINRGVQAGVAHDIDGQARDVAPDLGADEYPLEERGFLPLILREVDPQQGCIDSGGTLSVAMCCLSTGDFPNTCRVGACGCAPEYSHEVTVCDCGTNRCFNGSECVASPFGIGIDVSPEGSFIARMLSQLPLEE